MANQIHNKSVSYWSTKHLSRVIKIALRHFQQFIENQNKTL